MQCLAWRTAVRSGRAASAHRASTAAAAVPSAAGTHAAAATATSIGAAHAWTSTVFRPTDAAAPAAAGAARCSFHSSAHRLRAPAATCHYRTLGVPRTAAKADIKASYYKLAKQHHPDLTGSSNSEQFTRIQSAYEVLGDEKARKEYDARTSYSSPYSSGGSSTSSFWESASSPRPESQSYSYAAWSTRAGTGGSRMDDPWSDSGEWEYVVDDEGFTEEELFENLFGGGGGGDAGPGFAYNPGRSKRGTGAKRRGAAANASTSAAAKKRAAAAERQRARDREAEQAAADDAAAYEAAAASRAARTRARRKEEKRAAATSIAGADLSLEIPLTFVEAAQGTVKTIQFQADGSCRACGGGGSKPGSSSACRSCNGRGVQNMRMPGHQSMHVECERCNGTGTYETQCGTCHGSGHVKEKRTVEVQVPAGVDGTSNIRLLNQGHSGRRGGAHGHLLLKAIIAPHPIFKRVGYDLHSEHALPLTTALLGGVTQVPGLDGSIQSVRIEQGTQHLATRALPGRGIKILDKLPKGGVSSTGAPGSYTFRGGQAYGSQQVTWRVELPRELSAKSKDLLKQLALEMGNIQNIDLTTDIKKQSMAAAAAKKETAAPAAEPTPAPAARASAAPANGDTFAAAAASSSSSSSASAAAARAQSIPAGSAAAAAAFASAAATSGSTAEDTTTVFTRPRSGPAAARRAAGAARAAARVSAAMADASLTAAAAAASSNAAASSSPSSASATAASRDVEDEEFLSGTSRAAASSAAAAAASTPAASPAAAAAAATAEEEEEDVSPRLEDKRSGKYKRQLKKALKSKEHRRTIHLEPISVSARRIFETEENKYTQKQSVYNERAARGAGDRL